MTPAQDQAFTDFLRAKALEAEKKLKYRPAQFLQMLGSLGGYATAVQLLGSKDISEGFKTLWEHKRLDLTVEALVLEGQWRTHFPQILQDAAARRLLAAKYQLKLSPAPQMEQSAGAGAPAPSSPPALPPSPSQPQSDEPSVAVRITWPQTVETIPLSLGSLKAGDVVYTLETWKDETELTTYESTCTVIARGSFGWDVELRYDRTEGVNVAIAADYPDVKWGVTRLHISADLAKATASFTPDDGSAAGTWPCTVYRTSLYAQLSRAQVTVLLRPGQLALRTKMLALYGRCEISGETEHDALEAAHIIDHSASGSSIVENALLLRADLHALFDAGKLLIDAKGVIALKGVPATSRYHRELSSAWRQTLQPDVLARVKAALQERQRIKAR